MAGISLSNRLQDNEMRRVGRKIKMYFVVVKGAKVQGSPTLEGLH